MHVLYSGRTKDAFLATCARNIWLVSAQNDIDLPYKYIPGKQNSVADLLSRWQNLPSQVAELHNKVGGPVWLHATAKLLEINQEI